jgi:hypothetical protein
MQLQRRDDFEPAPRTILWLMPGHQPTLPLACHGSVGDHTTSRPDRQTLQCLVFGNRSDRSHLPTRQDLWSGALNQEGVNAHEIPQNQLLEFRFRVRSVSQFPVTRLYGQVRTIRQQDEFFCACAARLSEYHQSKWRQDSRPSATSLGSSLPG